MKRWYLVALLPALLGLLTSLVLNFGGLQNPILSIQIDIGTFARLVGIIISIPCVADLAYRRNSQRDHAGLYW